MNDFFDFGFLHWLSLHTLLEGGHVLPNLLLLVGGLQPLASDGCRSVGGTRALLRRLRSFVLFEGRSGGFFRCRILFCASLTAGPFLLALPLLGGLLINRLAGKVVHSVVRIFGPAIIVVLVRDVRPGSDFHFLLS